MIPQFILFHVFECIVILSNVKNAFTKYEINEWKNLKKEMTKNVLIFVLIIIIIYICDILHINLTLEVVLTRILSYIDL